MDGSMLFSMQPCRACMHAESGMAATRCVQVERAAQAVARAAAGSPLAGYQALAALQCTQRDVFYALLQRVRRDCWGQAWSAHCAAQPQALPCM